MNQKLQNELRKQLEEGRERLDREIHELRDVAVKASTYLEDENDGYDNHIADNASSLVERQIDMTLLANLQAEMESTARALQRMDEGTYATCEICDKPIADKRLQARPMATTCIECQSALEQRQRIQASADV